MAKETAQEDLRLDSKFEGRNNTIIRQEHNAIPDVEGAREHKATSEQVEESIEWEKSSRMLWWSDDDNLSEWRSHQQGLVASFVTKGRTLDLGAVSGNSRGCCGGPFHYFNISENFLSQFPKK